MKNLVHFKKSAEYKLFRAGGELYKRRSPSTNKKISNSTFFKHEMVLPKSLDKYSRTDEKRTILPVFFTEEHEMIDFKAICERRSIDSQLQPKPSENLFSSKKN